MDIEVRRLALMALLSVAPGLCQDALEPHLGKGFQLVEQDRYEDAANEFRAALSLDPQLSRARYQLAVCLFALGRRDEAREEFLEVDRERGGDPQASYYLGRIYLLAGDNANAIERLRPIVRSPPFPDTTFYLGCAYLASGKTSEALQWLKIAGEANPLDFRIHYRLARAFQDTGQKADAEREYELSTKAREHYDEAARDYNACNQALRSRPLAEAKTVCTKIFDRNDPDKLTLLGMVYGEYGDYEEALAPLQEAAHLDPDSFEIFHNLGVSFFRLRRFEEAEGQLSRAVALRPDYFGSNALLGAALFMLKRDERAYAVLDHAHQLNPDSADTSELLFREAMLLGEHSFEENHREAAAAYFRKAAEIHPDDPHLKERLAQP
jgi:tetratricopeptide (TPR) repeat protein